MQASASACTDLFFNATQRTFSATTGGFSASPANKLTTAASSRALVAPAPRREVKAKSTRAPYSLYQNRALFELISRGCAYSTCRSVIADGCTARSWLGQKCEYA
eukprot:2863298-Rhodomonas_salina.1